MEKRIKDEPQFHFAVWWSSVELIQDEAWDLYFDLDHRLSGMITIILQYYNPINNPFDLLYMKA